MGFHIQDLQHINQTQTIKTIYTFLIFHSQRNTTQPIKRDSFKQLWRAFFLLFVSLWKWRFLPGLLSNRINIYLVSERLHSCLPLHEHCDLRFIHINFGFSCWLNDPQVKMVHSVADCVVVAWCNTKDLKLSQT